MSIFCSQQSQHVQENVDDVIVKQHRAKNIILLIQLKFSVFPRNDQPGMISQIHGKETRSQDAIDTFIIGQKFRWQYTRL